MTDRRMSRWVLDSATAPWFGSCAVCRKELGLTPELVGRRPESKDFGWHCKECLESVVRAQVIATLEAAGY